ncbi:MAG: hypothetical protein JKY81_01545 [Colwellia sp.]|nr:hypothetical protein [Colwellia sp.]
MRDKLEEVIRAQLKFTAFDNLDATVQGLALAVREYMLSDDLEKKLRSIMMDYAEAYSNIPAQDPSPREYSARMIKAALGEPNVAND